MRSKMVFNKINTLNVKVTRLTKQSGAAITFCVRKVTGSNPVLVVGYPVTFSVFPQYR